MKGSARLALLAAATLQAACHDVSHPVPVPPPVAATVREVEPDDDFTTATPLPLGQAGLGDLSSSADPADYWSFAASEGQVITLEVFGARMDPVAWDASGAVPALTLYGTDGTTVLLRHDPLLWAASLGGTRLHDLDVPAFRIPATGTYYVALRSLDRTNTPRPGGPYAIRIGTSPLAVTALELEPPGGSTNGTLVTAEPVGPGVVYGYHDAGNLDLYTFTVASPTVVSLEMTAGRNGVAAVDYYRPQLRLLDAGGSPVALNAAAYFNDSALRYVVMTAGTYYVEVGEAVGNTGSAPYFLSVQLEAYAPAAEVEPNDLAATATSVGYGQTIGGNAGPADPDWYAFSGQAGDAVRVTAFDSSNREGAAAAVTVTLYAPDGATPLPSSGPDNPLRVTRTILQATGTFYIRVTAGTATDYAVRLERFLPAAYENEAAGNNTFVGAQSLDASGRAAGAIGAAGDADVYSFPAIGAELVTLNVYAGAGWIPGGDPNHDRHGSSLAPRVTVLGTGGAYVAHATRTPILGNVGASSITALLPTVAVTFNAPAGGTYYVVIEDEGGAGGPAFTYVVERQ